MSASLTLVTCTRNPNPETFRRVLESVAALQWPTGHAVEYLVIDSTSEPPVASRAGVGEFLGRVPWARVIRAEHPGLAAARRTALEASTGAILVWFDDDNVPAPDYLTHVVALAEARPSVTVWGAGRIDVEFTAPVPAWVERELPPTFQERHHLVDDFGHAASWASFFPVGSGLVTRRDAVERWATAVREGRYSLTGRSGARLSAGDDAQIILGAVAAGEMVGVVAAQQLTHLIPPGRCTMAYLKRLEFGLSGSIRVARAECFPGDPAPRSLDGLGPVSMLRATLAQWRRHGWRAGRFEAARQLGALSGTLQTTHRPEPWWLRAAIAVLRLR
jgi:hypothetical protein